MATNYTTQASKARWPAKFLHEGAVAFCSVFPLSAALAAGDTISMLTLPVGAMVYNAIISSDTALDTNAASTLSFQVGDSTLANRYITTHLQGNNQPMAPYQMDQAGGHQYVVTPTTANVIITVVAGAATGAVVGNLRLTMLYSMDNT